METHLLKEQQKSFKVIAAGRAQNKTIWAVISFILINAIKISIFNYYLLPEQNISTF